MKHSSTYLAPKNAGRMKDISVFIVICLVYASPSKLLSRSGIFREEQEGGVSNERKRAVIKHGCRKEKHNVHITHRRWKKR